MKQFATCIVGALILCAPQTHAQTLDNSGNEFLCAFLPNLVNDGIEIELHLSSDVSTTVNIEYPSVAPTFFDTVTVTPGSITVVTVPETAAGSWVPDTVSDNLVRAFSDDEFTCYQIHRRPFSSDAALGLPVDTMNTEFILADYDPTLAGFFSVFAVYARFDDTTVTITPSAALSGGHPAGTPYSVTLDAGESYFGRSTTLGPAGSITGTIVESDGVVGVSNGSMCSNVPAGVLFCDHLYEVAQATQTWGNDYLVANVPNRPNGSYYRIIGSTDGTVVEMDGVSVGTVNRGEYIQIPDLVGNHRFASPGGEAFFVVQYMTSQGSVGALEGDPSMGNVISSDQYKSEYTFSTVGGSQFAEHYLTIIADDADVGSLLLDGVAVPAGDFSAIGITGFSVAIILVTEGTHTTSSTFGHGVTIEGYNDDDSYLYPAGALFEFINPVGDANDPTCVSEAFPDRVEGTGNDAQPSEDLNNNGVLDPGEDLNNNGQIDEDTGVFFVQLAPGSDNLTLVVDLFQAGDGMVGFVATATDTTMSASGSVLIIDGAGNEANCPVSFDASIGTTVCDSVANSSGQRAVSTASGSAVALTNDVTLLTSGLPTMSMGYYFVSQGSGVVQMPGGYGGNLCIAGPVMGRHNSDILNSGAGTSVSLALDLEDLPQPMNGPAMVTAGSTWYWQLWYRDNTVFQGASNFCSGVSIDFQ